MMQKTLMRLSLFIFCLLPQILVAGELPEKISGEGEKLLDRFMDNTKSMKATFTQTLRTNEGDTLQQTSGLFYLQRPGKFRWNYAQPYEQEIVSDGTRIWIYDVELQQVTVQKPNVSLGNNPMALLENRAKLNESFNVTELGVEKGVYRLKLVSKTGESDFKAVILGLNKHGLVYMLLHDQFEQTTDIVFDHLTTNPELASDLFNFTPPEGVDVFGES